MASVSKWTARALIQTTIGTTPPHRHPVNSRTLDALWGATALPRNTTGAVAPHIRVLTPGSSHQPGSSLRSYLRSSRVCSLLPRLCWRENSDMMTSQGYLARVQRRPLQFRHRPPSERRLGESHASMTIDWAMMAFLEDPKTIVAGRVSGWIWPLLETCFVDILLILRFPSLILIFYYYTSGGIMYDEC